MAAKIKSENIFLKKRFIRLKLYHIFIVSRRDEGDENTASGGFAAGITNVIMLVGEIYS